MPIFAGGRVGGAADNAVAVHRSFPPNHAPAGDLVIGVVDTGFPEGDPHPWFGNHIEGSDKAVEPLPADPRSMLRLDDGHGTFVTGRILLEAPAATVRMARPTSWHDGEVSAAIGAVSGCGLINLSFLGDGLEQEPPAGIAAALADLPPETVVVIAAGNDRGSKVVYPAGIDLPETRARIITVGAVDQTRITQFGAPPPVADFSNFGSWVDCYAEGVQVLGPHVWYDEVADPDGASAAQTFRGWAVWSGTSFAAATVTGRIARVAMDLGTTPKEAATLVLERAPKIPVPNENPLYEPDWRPFVRGVTSTWGEIMVPTVPAGAPSS